MQQQLHACVADHAYKRRESVNTLIYFDEKEGKYTDRADLHRMVNGVGGLQCRDHILGARHQLEGLDCLRVRDGDVVCPPGILEPRVLRSDPRVVKPGGNRARFGDLTVGILGGGNGSGKRTTYI